MHFKDNLDLKWQLSCPAVKRIVILISIINYITIILSKLYLDVLAKNYGIF